MNKDLSATVILISELAYLYTDRDSSLSRRDAVIKAIQDIFSDKVTDEDTSRILKKTAKYFSKKTI